LDTLKLSKASFIPHTQATKIAAKSPPRGTNIFTDKNEIISKKFAPNIVTLLKSPKERADGTPIKNAKNPVNIDAFFLCHPFSSIKYEINGSSAENF